MADTEIIEPIPGARHAAPSEAPAPSWRWWAAGIVWLAGALTFWAYMPATGHPAPTAAATNRPPAYSPLPQIPLPLPTRTPTHSTVPAAPEPTTTVRRTRAAQAAPTTPAPSTARPSAQPTKTNTAEPAPSPTDTGPPSSPPPTGTPATPQEGRIR